MGGLSVSTPPDGSVGTVVIAKSQPLFTTRATSPDGKVWDYSDEELQVLCEACHSGAHAPRAMV